MTTATEAEPAGAGWRGREPAGDGRRELVTAGLAGDGRRELVTAGLAGDGRREPVTAGLAGDGGGAR